MSTVFNLLIKVFYDGTLFHGSQRQPRLRTVEGEVIKAFRNIGLNFEKFVASGRTDKGVHALSQVFMLTVRDVGEEKVEEVIGKVREELPVDIIIWGYRIVNFEFNPRFNAICRRYVYVRYARGFNVHKASEIAKRFIGKHDFKCFSSYLYSQVPEFISTERTILGFNIFKTDDIVIFDIVADSFLRQMVRRIVSFTELYVAGKKSIKDLNTAFKGICEVADVKPAAPENLILFDVTYPFSFKIISESVREMKEYWMKKSTKHILFKFLYEHVDFKYDKPVFKQFSLT